MANVVRVNFRVGGYFTRIGLVAARWLGRAGLVTVDETDPENMFATIRDPYEDDDIIQAIEYIESRLQAARRARMKALLDPVAPQLPQPP